MLLYKRIILILGLSVVALLISRTWERPLQGIHGHRQADTLFAGYSYCFEKTDFFLPKIIHRENTNGVSIGELPLFSWLLGVSCYFTGEWSETFPKWVSIFLFLLSALVWVAWFRLESKDFFKLRIEEGVGIFIFTSLFLAHFTIPLPDVLAVFLIGVSGLCFQKHQSFKNNRNLNFWLYLALGGSLFLVGFWIRPYLIFLLPIILRKTLKIIFVTLIAMVIYFLWYKGWAVEKSDIKYYNTHLLPPRQALVQFIPALGYSIKQLVFEHINFIGLPLLFLALKKEKRWMIFWVGSFLAVILLRGMHVKFHNYYLMSAGILSFLLILSGYLQITEKQQVWFLGLFVLISIGHNQHLWHRPNVDPWVEIQSQIQQNQVGEAEKIVVYSDSPTDLYLAKRTGFLLGPKTEQNNSCPKGINFYMQYEGDFPKIQKCVGVWR